MPKFLIIDGSSMLSTSYYGNLPKSILFAKTEEEKERHYPELLHTSDGNIQMLCSPCFAPFLQYIKR